MGTAKEGRTGPIRCALEARFIAKTAESNRLSSSFAELAKVATPSQPETVLRVNEQKELLEQLYEDAKELAEWLFPPLSMLSDSERNQTLQTAQAHFLKEGFSPLETLENLRDAQARPHGRPANKRHLAVTALDMWLMNPRLSWALVTRDICNCGEGTHGRDCQERLRQQVNDLRALLRKLSIQEPPRKAAR